MGRMMIVIEVHLAPGADPTELLSEETLRETQAQVMTFAQAKQVGFGGLGDPPSDHEVRLIAVAQRDARWIQQKMEAHAGVSGFRVHEVG